VSISILRPGVEYYAERIRLGETFAFVRYGEGDLQVIVPSIPIRAWIVRHWAGWTKPGVQKVIRRTLTECYVDTNYLVGLWNLEYFIAKRKMSQLEGWLRILPVSAWHDGGVFKEAVQEGKLGCVVEAMRHKSVVLVGPERLSALASVLGWKDCRHVVVHASRAFSDWRKTTKALEKLHPDVFAFSAGVAAKVMIHHLWPRMTGSSLVDFGAVWDVFVGRVSRLYHRELTPAQLERNLSP